MNKELYVSSTPHETKVALVEDDQLAEVFFERENEYTLAGSIYKGRVTRVLPGMQSAFVDIGLERDAFLYVSDFLELTGDEEEDAEFGEIPTPRGTIDLGKAQPVQEARPSEAPTVITGPDAEEDVDLSAEFASEEQERSATEDEGESPAPQEQESGDGSRRWRGRRRRGGRRGRGEQNAASDAAPKTAPPEEEPPAPRAESRPRQDYMARTESRPRQDYGPPAGYTPIILPGESISKYRNLNQPTAEAQLAAAAHTDQGPTPVEEFTAETNDVAGAPQEVEQEIAEEAAHLDQGFDIAEREREEMASSAALEPVAPTEPQQTAPAAETAAHVDEDERPRSKRRWGNWRRKLSAPAEQTPHPAAPAEPIEARPEPDSPASQTDEPPAEAGVHHSDAAEAQPESATHAQHEPETPAMTAQHTAPSVAPEGRTLEHEVLEDEETEFQPMPDDLTALREVAGDEELVLEEETLDAGNGYSERWVPKIDDVDEDEVRRCRDAWGKNL